MRHRPKRSAVARRPPATPVGPRKAGTPCPGWFNPRMTTARTVPVTTEMDGDELDAEDAWRLARRYGLVRIAVAAFVRFRYGDGFTNSRALALQACLAVIPFLLALTGLSADIDHERPAAVVAHVVDSLSPGSGEGDALASAVDGSDASER